MMRARLGVAALVLALAACDSGPSGPGTIDAVVESPQALGAVVLEFAGVGIEGFEAQGSTQAYSARLSGAEPKWRVVLVSPDGGSLRFGIQVTDRRSVQPVVTAVTAATPSNIPVTPGGLQVRLER